MTDDTLSVALALPFSAAAEVRREPAGNTIAEIVAARVPDPLLRQGAHVSLGGEYIPRDRWARIRPKPGAALAIRIMPMGGGGGKNPLRTILSLALIAASPVISGALGGMLGVTPFLGRVITGGLNLVSRLALNALAPPARPRFAAQKESPSLFIQGARNNAVPFGRVPKVLGRHRFVPPLGALPYTETAGNDQYLRMLFVWGYGPLHIADLKIGETPLSDFDGVEIETRQGFADDPPLTLYSNSVIQNDLEVTLRQEAGYVLRTSEADADEISVDITLPRGLFRFAGSVRKEATVRIEVHYAPAGTEDWSAPGDGFAPHPARTLTLPAAPGKYRRTQGESLVSRIDCIAMDSASGRLSILRGAEHRDGIDEGAAAAPPVPPDMLALAEVLRRSDEPGAIPPARITDLRAAARLYFSAEEDFAVTAPGETCKVAIAAGGLQFPGLVITAKQSAALRHSLGFKVPKGQYDVRLRRLTPDAVDDNLFDETVWTALRTLRYAYPVNMPGLAMTALRIRATEQLSGLVDRFNGVVHSILPDWDGANWVDQVTSNPASLFRHVLQGNANARPLPDSRLDLDRLAAWHENCSAAGRAFNAVIDHDLSVREVLSDIAAAGRASPTLIDGKWAVVEDRPQTVPVQHFTPRNTWRFEGRKAFDDAPQALRVRFINAAKGWLQDERIVYDDGFDETDTAIYETLDLTGVTDAEQAWRDGRYHIATARLRPETYSFSCDIEHLVCTRGDLVRFTHDVPLFGLMSARVKSLTLSGEFVTGVTLDAEVTMESGKAYAIRFRKTDGASIVAQLLSLPGAHVALSFAAPLAAADAPAAGDLALFGEAGSESVELIVKSIAPQNDLAARLTCVDAAPEVHLADQGEIPAFQSRITLPPEMRRPPAPVLAAIQSGEEALIRNTDGSLTTRILVCTAPPDWPRPLALQAMIRASGENIFRPAEALSQGPGRLSLADVTEGEAYDIQLRHVSPAGLYSPPLLIHGHRVAGTAALPSDVAGFGINMLGDTAHLSWDAVADLDLSHYALRFSPDTADAAWSGAVDIVTRIPADATSISLPAMPGTYLIKAVDVGGRQSAAAATAVAPVNAAAGLNAVLSLAAHPVFTGLRDGAGVSEGALQLEGRDSPDDWQDMDAIANADIGAGGLCDAGSYQMAGAADLGAVYTSRLTATLGVAGIDLNASLDDWGDLDALESFDQSADPSLWSVQLQLRRTADDPALAPAWSDWAPFIAGDYTARAFQFRLLMAAKAANVTPAVYALGIDIDMPDRLDSGCDLVSHADGTAIAFAPAFRATPAISVTPRDMQAGDYYAITVPAPNGFGIRFFNSAGAGIARRFDWLARGYGAEA